MSSKNRVRRLPPVCALVAVLRMLPEAIERGGADAALFVLLGYLLVHLTQHEVIDFLKHCKLLGDGTVEVFQTHGALVFECVLLKYVLRHDYAPLLWIRRIHFSHLTH